METQRSRKYSVVLRNTRRFCQNWPSVALHYILRRRLPPEVVLRNGVRIVGTVRPNQLWSLLDLLAAGWTIRRDDEANLLVVASTKDAVEMRFRPDGVYANPLAEIYLEHVYGDSFSQQTVVDVGMGTGDSSIYFAKRGARRVVGLEPFPDSYKLSQINVHANGLDSVVTPVNAALSSRVGQTELSVVSNSPGLNAVSGSGGAPPPAEYDTKISVPTTTLEALVSDYHLESIDLMKIDCEGSEYEVMRSATPPVLGRIRAIVMEYHSGPQDLPELLRKSGFEVHHRGSPTGVGYLEARRPASA
jgi:FkbM family methyltransferase